jgi:tRNA U34 2-thiouridine synthase MnmA/TrmU
LVQSSAHGAAHEATIGLVGGMVDGRVADRVDVEWVESQRRIAPGQSVVVYDLADRRVIGGGVAAR